MVMSCHRKDPVWSWMDLFLIVRKAQRTTGRGHTLPVETEETASMVVMEEEEEDEAKKKQASEKGYLGWWPLLISRRSSDV